MFIVIEARVLVIIVYIVIKEFRSRWKQCNLSSS